VADVKHVEAAIRENNSRARCFCGSDGFDEFFAA
jgi:hypothetical protein